MYLMMLAEHLMSLRKNMSLFGEYQLSGELVSRKTSSYSKMKSTKKNLKKTTKTMFPRAMMKNSLLMMPLTKRKQLSKCLPSLKLLICNLIKLSCLGPKLFGRKGKWCRYTLLFHNLNMNLSGKLHTNQS